MSKFTTEVRFICETLAGRTESAGGDSINSIINTAAPLLFNFDFPIFDESYRLPLETKILRHYYTREICEETVGLWKLRLQDRLNMIMPYYNKLYQSELLQFNPLYDVDVTRNHTKENSGNENRSTNSSENVQGSANKAKTEVTDTDTTNTAETKTQNTIDTDTTNTKANTGTISNTSSSTDNSTSYDSNTKWDLYSDTPQGGINGITNDNDSIANNTYLTNARKITENNQRTGTDTGSTQGTQTNNLNEAGSGTIDTTENGSIDKSETGTIDTTVNENEQLTNTTAKTSTGSGTTTLSNTEDYIEHVVGKQGVVTYSKMLNEFRTTFLNIDSMVIDALSDLFFGLWA